MTSVLILALYCERIAADVARWSLASTDSVVLRRADERRAERDERTLDIALDDPRMSSSHARLIRIGERWIVEDRGSKNGTIINGRPLMRAALSDGDLIEVGRMLLMYRELDQPDVVDLDRRELKKQPRAVRTLSAALERTYRQLAQLLATPGPVAVFSEDGTSSESISRPVHELGGKRGKLVVQSASKLDLARAPEAGTLVIERVEELDPGSRHAVAGLIGDRPALRVVLSSHDVARSLPLELDAACAGRSVSLPPLRSHREDIGMLIASGLRAASAEFDWAVEPDAARALLGHGWPGNQRELDTVLAAAAPLAKDGLLRLEHLPELAAPTLIARDDDRARDELCSLLTRNRGNVSAVARALGRGRSSVRRELHRLRIDPRAYR